MHLLFLILISFQSTDLAVCQRHGIKGTVEWISGDQMPGPDKPESPVMGIQREIWIYEPVFYTNTNVDGVFFFEIPTRLVKKVTSKSNGRFKVKLPPGEYSIFVMEEKGLFANSFDSQNRINCVKVTHGKMTEISIRVDYEAVY